MPRQIALFTDETGLPVLLDTLPRANVRCVVAAGTRPAAEAFVRTRAAALELPFLVQPPAKSPLFPEFLAAFQKWAPDALLCSSYALRIPESVLSVVGGNAWNLHYSLLPKNRGPNPLQWALIRGEAETGATLHWMDGDFDSGDVAVQTRVAIAFEDTWLTLRDKVAAAAAELLKRTASQILAGSLPRTPQDPTQATMNTRLTADSPRIDWTSMNDRQVYDLVRAQVSPLAGAFVETPQGRRHFPEKLSLEEIAKLRA